MDIEKIIKQLSQNSRILNHLSDHEIMEFLRCCRSQSFKDKQIIFNETSSGTELFIILSGSVVVKKSSKTIDIIRIGECFGEMGAISGDLRSASTEASGDVLLLAAGMEKIDNLDPAIQIKVLKNVISIVSERLRKRTEEVIK